MGRPSARRAVAASATLLLASVGVSRAFDTRGARRRSLLPHAAASARAFTESLLGSAEPSGGVDAFNSLHDDDVGGGGEEGGSGGGGGVFGHEAQRAMERAARDEFNELDDDDNNQGGGVGGVLGAEARRAAQKARAADEAEAEPDLEERALRPSYRLDAYELSAHELNKMFVPDSLDRHKFTVSPDAAFGAIFKWSMLVDWESYVRLAVETWEEVVGPADAERLASALESMPLCLALPHTVRRVTHADEPPAEQFKIAANYFEKYEERFAAFPHTLAPGAHAVLETLGMYSVALAVCCDVQPGPARAALRTLGLDGQLNAIVVGAEHSSAGQMYLQAALSLERPPSRCVVFDDTLHGVREAHEVLMKAVACASRQPQYELKPADLIVGRLEDVSMVALRALFMSDDAFDDDPDSGMQKESATQPVRDFWGNELGSTRRMVMDPDTMDGGSSGGDDSWLYGGSGGAADAAE